LTADCRLGEPQVFAGSGDAALSRNCPKVQEVVIVQPFHQMAMIHRLNRCFVSKLSTTPIAAQFRPKGKESEPEEEHHEISIQPDTRGG
jgi:hypothetical protein